jgi:hypothetical protein
MVPESVDGRPDGVKAPVAIGLVAPPATGTLRAEQKAAPGLDERVCVRHAERHKGLDDLGHGVRFLAGQRRPQAGREKRALARKNARREPPLTVVVEHIHGVSDGVDRVIVTASAG